MKQNKKKLYESIMASVAREVKKALNEEFNNPEYIADIFMKSLDPKDVNFNNIELKRNYANYLNGLNKPVYKLKQSDLQISFDKKWDYNAHEDSVAANYCWESGSHGLTSVFTRLFINLEYFINDLNNTHKKINLNWLDTSNIKYMCELFRLFDVHNVIISKWDVSNVEDMNGMFLGTDFNGDISKWNVSNVKDMSYMFAGSKFNRDISNWNISNATKTKNMFKGCKILKNYMPKIKNDIKISNTLSLKTKLEMLNLLFDNYERISDYGTYSGDYNEPDEDDVLESLYNQLEYALKNNEKVKLDKYEKRIVKDGLFEMYENGSYADGDIDGVTIEDFMAFENELYKLVNVRK